MQPILTQFVGLENALHRQLVRHSITALRLSLGAIFLLFGVLKFFPGVSPAEDLVIQTTDLLTFGLIPGGVALVGIAALECFIGACFLLNRWMRLAIWLLVAQLVGILSPLVLLTGQLFSGPSNAPTLEGQYVLKDLILVASGMVVAAATFRGGRLIRDEPSSVAGVPANRSQKLNAARKLEVVLEGARDDRSVAEVCRDRGVSEADYYEWRDQAFAGATAKLDHETRTQVTA